MKEIVITFWLLLFFFLNSFSQKIEWSVPEQINNKVVNTEIIGATADYYFILKYDKKINQSFVIERFGKDLRSTGRYEFKIEKNKSVEKVLCFNNRIFIFFNSFEKVAKTYQLTCRILNDDLEVVSDNSSLTKSAKQVSENNAFLIGTDRLQNKFYIFSLNSDSSEIKTYSISTFNQNLEKIHSGTISTTYTGDFSIEQLELADNNVAVLFKTILVGKPRNDQKSFAFVSINLETQEKNTMIVSPDSLFPDKMIFRYNLADSRFYLTGFYGKEPDGYYNGFLLYKIIPGKNKYEFQKIEFPTEIVSELMGKSETEHGITDYALKSIILRNDSGVVLLCEFYLIQREVLNDYYSFNNSYIKLYYRFSDVICVSISPEGTVDWYKVVHKDQITVNDEGFYSSFTYGNLSSQIAIIYNDISRSRWNLLYSNFTPDGNFQNQVLVNGVSFDGALIPQLGKQVTTNEILIPGYDNRKGFVLLRITL